MLSTTPSLCHCTGMSPVDTTGWPAGSWDWVYQNVNKTTRLEVSSRNNVLIIGSNIHDVANDEGMLISYCNNVQIKDSFIQNLTDESNVYGMGLFLYHSDNVVVDNITIREHLWTGTAQHAHAVHIYDGDNITVKNSDIYNVDGNGITVEAENSNVLIDNCDIYNTGRRPYSASAPYHGIYCKGPDTTIQNCSIHDSLDGSAITMRTTGLIQNNTIYNNKHVGIAYWPDYLKGPSNALEIRYNTLWQDNFTAADSKASAICINYTTGKPAEKYFANFYIHNNQCEIKAGNSYGVISCFQATGTWNISNVQVKNNTITDRRATKNYLDGEEYMRDTSGNTYQ